jgi:hypothetical protein
MKNENDESAYTWDDEDDMGATLRDPYPGASNSRRPQSLSGSSSADSTRPVRRARPRGVPGSADFYEEIEDGEPAARPRKVRQSREEVEARLRQRARQPIYSRDAEEQRSRTSQPRRPQPRPPQRSADPVAYQPQEPARQPRPTRATRDFSLGEPARRTVEFYDANDEYNGYDESAASPERRRRSEHRHHHRRERRGRVFSTLFTGCLGGLITLLVVAAVLAFLILHNTPLGQHLGVTTTVVNQPPQTQTLALNNATQLIVKDQTGNVSVSVDQNASVATLTSVKHVQASSQSDANNQFKQISLSVKALTQGADPSCIASSCLLITATTPVPSNGGILGGGNGDSIDLTITLPPGFNSPEPGSPDTISVSADAGNVSVNGFNGVLNLNGNAGNITVAHSLIFASTCIQTLHGDINIAQQSIFDLTSSSSLVPCSNTSSTDPHRPWFNVKSGVGNVTITLTTNLNNLLLDANTNDGTIAGDFNLPVTVSDNSYSYHGPIIPNTNPTASLYVATSTGNIVLHKQTS